MTTGFKNLPKGVKRLLIAGTAIVPFFFGIIITKIEYGEFDGEYFLFSSVMPGIILYWFFVMIGIWVYEGFKNPTHC